MFQQNFHPSHIQSQVPFQGLHHFLWCGCTSIFHVLKKKLFIHHPTKCHSKVLHHFQNADVIYYAWFKKRIHPSPYKVPFKSITSLWKCGCDLLSMFLKKQFIHHLTKCHSKVLHHFQKCGCDLLSMFLKRNSSITLQSAIQKYYITFKMRMWSIYPCLKKEIHPSPYKVRFKSLTSLFKMQMNSIINVSQIVHLSPSNCHSKVLHHSLSKCGCNL
jgi:hypothetical protein